jgi:hypothetical protein
MMIPNAQWILHPFFSLRLPYLVEIESVYCFLSSPEVSYALFHL